MCNLTPRLTGIDLCGKCAAFNAQNTVAGFAKTLTEKYPELDSAVIEVVAGFAFLDAQRLYHLAIVITENEKLKRFTKRVAEKAVSVENIVAQKSASSGECELYDLGVSASLLLATIRNIQDQS